MYVWMAGNSRTADDRGGAYEAFCGLQAFATYDDAAFDVADLLTREPDDISITYVGVGASEPVDHFVACRLSPHSGFADLPMSVAIASGTDASW